MEHEGSLPCLQQPATCSYSQPYQSSPGHPSLFLQSHLNIILPYTPRSSKWPLSLRFPPHNTVCNSPLPIHATCSAHLTHLNLIIQTISGEKYISLSSSSSSFLHSPVTSSLLGPNILLNTLFSNTLSLCSSLSVSDQVSHPHKTRKIIVLYILIFIFLDSKLAQALVALLYVFLPT